MATDSVAEKLNYIIFCLTRAEISVNFEEVATLLKLRDSEEARAKFKTIVEASGKFKLEGDKIVPAKSDPVTPPVASPPRTPMAPRKSSQTARYRYDESPTPRQRKRKRQRETQSLSLDDSF